MKKTNALRMLDRLGVSYEVEEYKVDEDDLSAEHAAKQLGVPLEQVFKTLVVYGDKTGVLIASIPGGKVLDLKSLARISENKKAEMASLDDIKKLTGYIRGAVSPVGMKTNYPYYLDESASYYPIIYVSAGLRGLQIGINPLKLVKILDAVVAKIAR